MKEGERKRERGREKEREGERERESEGEREGGRFKKCASMWSRWATLAGVSSASAMLGLGQRQEGAIAAWFVTLHYIIV